MEPRIYGVETEYGISSASSDGATTPFDAEESARELFLPAVARGRTTNMFLPNGGRIYLDVGAHPEYATAECDNLWDLLAQDRAGVQILAEMAEGANAGLAERGVDARLHLFRNNYDSAGHSFGCHENYLVRRGRNFRAVADALIAFFVTRQIVSGAGEVLTQTSHGDGAEDAPEAQAEPQYCFSARAEEMWDAVSAATTRARPIINTRDEPLADAGSYRRLHVIVGDSNMAEPTTALKVGATELLLEAIDRGVDLTDLALEDPIAAIRDISRDLTGKLQLPMADGTSRSAVQIQQAILDRVKGSIPAEELTELQVYVVDLWQRAITAVATGDWDTISTEIDFAIKKRLLDGYMARTGAALDDPRVARLLLSYHDITDGGLQDRLEEAGLMLRLTSKEQVTRAMSAPPSTTRAHLRGSVIRAAEENRRDLGVDWVHLRLEDGQQTIALQDPFATEDPRVDQMIATIERSRPLPA